MVLKSNPKGESCNSYVKDVAVGVSTKNNTWVVVMQVHNRREIFNNEVALVRGTIVKKGVRRGQ